MDDLQTATIEEVRAEVRRLVVACKPLCPELTREDVEAWPALSLWERRARGYDSGALQLIEASLWLRDGGDVGTGRRLVRMWPQWMLREVEAGDVVRA